MVVPERVKSGTLSAICRLFGGEGCGDVKGLAAQPKTDPAPGVTYGPPVPVDPNAPVNPVIEGLDPNDPDVQRYNNAKTENTNADQAVTDAQADADQVLKQIKDFLLDVVGWTDLQKCISSGDVVACIETLINIVPWGKVFKLLKKIPGAIKLAQALKKLYETVSSAKKRKEAAEKALKEADDILKKKPKKPVACKRPSSFLPGTQVLLADGSHRPIEQINIGDQVWATDPLSKVSGPRTVTALISSKGAKELIDLSVETPWFGQADSSPFFPPLRLTATGSHPFWNPDRKAWIQASDLEIDDRLAQPDGRTVTVNSLRQYEQWQQVHNFPVEDLHSYYVKANDTDVLVHNDPDPTDPCKAAIEKKIRDAGYTDPLPKGVRRVGNGIIDESEKALDPDELAMAEQLAREGKIVKSKLEKAEQGLPGRTGDVEIDGAPTEFKTLKGSKQNPTPTANTLKRSLNSAMGQARSAIVKVTTPMSRDEALTGVKRFLGQPHADGALDKIRVVGDGWEINCVPGPDGKLLCT